MDAPTSNGWRATLHHATRLLTTPKFMDLAALSSCADALDEDAARALLLAYALEQPGAEVRAALDDARGALTGPQRGALLEEMMRQWGEVSYNIRYLYLMDALNALAPGADVAGWLLPMITEMREAVSGARARKASFAVGAIESCGGNDALALLRAIGDDMRSDPMQRRAARFAAIRLSGHDATDDDGALVAELLGAHAKLPKFLKDLDLPDLFLLSDPDSPIPREATESLAVALSNLKQMPGTGRGSNPNAGMIERARLALDPRSTGALADALYDAWGHKKFHGRYKWIKWALALFGDDRVVVKLEEDLRAWPRTGDTGRKRAIAMMDVLLDIGTDTALMVLLYLSYIQDVPSVWERALGLMNSVAKRRHVSATRMGDLIIPDCGLDERGARVFDIGDRELEVVFDENFEPRLVDTQTRERLDHMPRTEAAAQAREDWDLMHEILRDVIKIQNVRLEQSMVTERRWSQDEWMESIFNHPLMINYARRLVWGLFDRDDDLVATFRATEDRELVDVDDETFTMPKGLKVGLVHPLHMDRGLRSAWSQSFGDYEIFSPIEQLGRATYGAADEHFDGVTFSPGPFKAGMKRNLWRRDTSGGGVRDRFDKTFGHGVNATIRISPGFYPGSGDWGDPQSLTSIKVSGGKGGRADIAYSEAIRDLDEVLATTPH
jgi:hypothetical protein